MSTKEVIKNYIYDNYGVTPNYYDMRKAYVEEMYFMNWACKDIMYWISLVSDQCVMEALDEYINTLEYCVKHAKSQRAEIIFKTAHHIATEVYQIL